LWKGKNLRDFWLEIKDKIFWKKTKKKEKKMMEDGQKERIVQ
jgi:hypothetical protein